MSEPLVCAVCLTKDRPAMLQRAIRCFRAQTYENKTLVIWDSSVKPYSLSMDLPAREYCVEDIGGFTIGKLRNRANQWACENYNINPDIVMHWDSDDWSAPTRMAEQVAVLQSGVYDATGYSDMLFWDTTAGQFCSAWFYAVPHQKCDSVLGTSLAYWRETWDRKPFRDTSRGEDFHFYSGLRIRQLTSLKEGAHEEAPQYPMMVASIHGGNECSQIIPGHEQWRRVPEWDTRLKAIMEL